MWGGGGVRLSKSGAAVDEDHTLLSLSLMTGASMGVVEKIWIVGDNASVVRGCITFQVNVTFHTVCSSTLPSPYISRPHDEDEDRVGRQHSCYGGNTTVPDERYPPHRTG